MAVPSVFFVFSVHVILRFLSSRLKGYEIYNFIILGSCENRQLDNYNWYLILHNATVLHIIDFRQHSFYLFTRGVLKLIISLIICSKYLE